ncbi:MAG: hypothetical protein ACLSB9_09630 [Hydrogeniiclostridium mannosilyticum]
MRLLELLAAEYPQALRQRYKFEELPQPLEGAALLELVGRKRGMLVSGGEVDTLRAATMLLDEFRAESSAELRWRRRKVAWKSIGTPMSVRHSKRICMHLRGR